MIDAAIVVDRTRLYHSPDGKDWPGVVEVAASGREYRYFARWPIDLTTSGWRAFTPDVVLADLIGTAWWVKMPPLVDPDIAVCDGL